MQMTMFSARTQSNALASASAARLSTAAAWATVTAARN